MVRYEVHADSIILNRSVCLGEVVPQVLHAVSALCHAVDQVVKCPAVVHVERRFAKLHSLVFILSQGEHVGVRPAQFAHRIVPEVGRYLACYVATETVDADLVHPEVHGFLHGSTHVFVLIVELADVRPIILNHQLAVLVAVVPTCVLRPFAVRSGMVGNPIKDNLHAQLVRLGKKMLKILARTELGVELAVVNNAVITAQRAFSGQLANGLQRHYPDNIHTHLF